MISCNLCVSLDIAFILALSKLMNLFSLSVRCRYLRSQMSRLHAIQWTVLVLRSHHLETTYILHSGRVGNVWKWSEEHGRCFLWMANKVAYMHRSIHNLTWTRFKVSNWINFVYSQHYMAEFNSIKNSLFSTQEKSSTYNCFAHDELKRERAEDIAYVGLFPIIYIMIYT